jgi:phosphatidylserine decarboxylase
MFINTRWIEDNRALSTALILLFIGCYKLVDRFVRDFLSFSRFVSKLTGLFCDSNLPPYFRAALYKAFGTMYKVKFHEAVVENLNDFPTFNAFFTRKLKADARPISDEKNPSSLCSPCDGTVLSVGEVNAKDSTLECIKGNNYRLDEFLFGC